MGIACQFAGTAQCCAENGQGGRAYSEAVNQPPANGSRDRAMRAAACIVEKGLSAPSASPKIARHGASSPDQSISPHLRVATHPLVDPMPCLQTPLSQQMAGKHRCDRFDGPGLVRLPWKRRQLSHRGNPISQYTLTGTKNQSAGIVRHYGLRCPSAAVSGATVSVSNQRVYRAGKAVT